MHQVHTKIPLFNVLHLTFKVDLPLLLELLRELLDECDELQEDDEDEDEEEDELDEDEEEDLLRLCFLFRFSRPKENLKRLYTYFEKHIRNTQSLTSNYFQNPY